ncbi:hypothetical protein CGK06_24630, partial [Vibrio parahaemolyticus]
QALSPHLSVPYIERSLYSGLSSFGGDALRFTCVWRFELNTDFPRFKRKKREGYASRKLLHDDSREQLIEL